MENGLGILIIVILIFFVLSKLGGSLDSGGFGSGVSSSSSFSKTLYSLNPFSPTKSLSRLGASSAIGRAIVLSKAITLYREAGGAVSGVVAAGSKVVIAGAAILKDGFKYWPIIGDGVSGYAEENDLLADQAAALSSAAAPVGTRVFLTKDVIAREIPGGVAAGTHKGGNFGTVSSGPIFYDGERQWFVDFKDGKNGYVPESALSDIQPAPFSPGEVIVPKHAVLQGRKSVLDEPAGSEVGVQLDGAPGIITAGPESAGGIDYVYVDFERGADGFVNLESLTDETGKPIAAGKTAIGSFIITSGETAILDAPAGEPTGTVPQGSIGEIKKGPTLVDGRRYWLVDFGDEKKGYVDEGSLRDLVFMPFNNGGTLVGSEVVISQSTAVWDNPSGNLVGYQKRSASGVIVRGPFYSDSRYWFVDFKNAPDGFVLEDSLFVPVNHPIIYGILSFFRSFLKVLILLMFTVIAYAAIRISQVFAAFRKKTVAEVAKANVQEGIPHPRWEKVRDHLSSENPNDWRLAIMEADIILGEMLERMSYGKGNTIGERLQTIEPSDFTTLDKAWEAHKVRNMIAHEGSDFILTQREAKRVIELYREVFHEFRYI